MDLGKAIELRGAQPVGYMDLYVLLSDPVWFLTLLRMLISLFLMELVGSLSCSNKKRTISGRLSPNANILNELWTRWRKDSTDLPERPVMGALQLPSLPPMKLKIRVTLSYPTYKVFVKVSKRSVVDMAFKPTSKSSGPSKASWSPPKTRTLWSTKVVPSTGTNVVT